MNIERINENQIRCVISNEELEERELKPSEFAYGGQKARMLLEEMMSKASREYDFNVDKGNPLMIEATSSENGIVLTITKDHADERIAGYNKAVQNLDNANIFSFPDLNRLIEFSKIVKGIQFKASKLFKETDNNYLLTLMKTENNSEDYIKISNMLLDYGFSIFCDGPSLAYISEHCEVIIKDNVFSKLSMM